MGTEEQLKELKVKYEKAWSLLLGYKEIAHNLLDENEKLEEQITNLKKLVTQKDEDSDTLFIKYKELEDKIADLKEKLEAVTDENIAILGRYKIRGEINRELEGKNRELEGRLSEIRKHVDEFLFEVQSAIELMIEDYEDLDKQYYEKNVKRLNEAFLHYKKELAVLLKLKEGDE